MGSLIFTTLQIGLFFLSVVAVASLFFFIYTISKSLERIADRLEANELTSLSHFPRIMRRVLPQRETPSRANFIGRFPH